MRADKFFAARFGSRTKANEALKAGMVSLGGKPVSPDDEVDGSEPFSFAEEDRFVSNGGYKLERGLEAFGYSPEGKVFADLGASTGGFTECLLRRGAKLVFCVDVGENQLSAALRSDARVCVMDRTNARFLTSADFPCPLDGVVSDLSFISLRLILPAVFSLLSEGGSAIVLFKPQFECGREGLGKGGICPKRLHGELLADFYDFCTALGLAPRDIVNAPVRPRKNLEYLVHLVKGAAPLEKGGFLARSIRIF